MDDTASQSIHLSALRPLVRYVDQHQAILDIHTQVDLPGTSLVSPHSEVVMEITLHEPQGEFITHRHKLNEFDPHSFIRFELPEPQRWWPAGMGEQPLYELSVRLLVDDAESDQQTATLGLASVRTIDDVAGPSLLIHGRPCDIHSVLQVKPIDENAILPVGTGSLLIVRQHFGSQLLYEAADRAGLLLIQSIPAPSQFDGADLSHAFYREVNRLAPHPSLAGWLVEQADNFGHEMVQVIHHLDPTRRIFRSLPGLN